MHSPANFDSLVLDGLLVDWLGALKSYSVESLVILGPSIFGTAKERSVLAVHPPKLLEVSTALADSDEFGYDWQASDSPLVAWQNISRSSYADLSRWRLLALAHGLQSMVRVEFALPRARAFECFLLTSQAMQDRTEAAAIVWSALNIWPQIKRVLGDVTCGLSPREKEALALAFDGLTAAYSATIMDCTERTVTYHLANAMRKLKVDSKLAAIERACWYGVI
jgi:LuxR family transcriptional regulator, quorum-sensing system regulator SolR